VIWWEVAQWVRLWYPERSHLMRDGSSESEGGWKSAQACVYTYRIACRIAYPICTCTRASSQCDPQTLTHT